MSIREKGGATRCLSLLAGVCLLAATVPAYGLGGGTASLLDAKSRYHPDPSLTGFSTFQKFTVYAGPSLEADGWQLIDSLTSDYYGMNPTTGQAISGDMRSEVWRNTTTNYLLFAYEVAADAGANSPVSQGNIAGYDYDAGNPGHSVTIVDSGIIHLNGPVTLLDDDPLRLRRDTPSGAVDPAMWFYFSHAKYPLSSGYGLNPGFSGNFFFETESLYYVRSWATLQDSGASDNDIPVFVPDTNFPEPLGMVPEPVTVLGLLLGLGGLGNYIRRRRTR